MKQSSVISPSILSADFARLGEDTKTVLDAGLLNGAAVFPANTLCAGSVKVSTIRVA